LEKSKKINLINVGLFLLACILLWVRSTNSPLLRAILQEDGPFENIQAVLFFLSGLGFVLIYIKNSKNWWYLAVSLLLFALAGEEISWGQRIFSIASPAWEMKDNVQGELNLHNINGIHQHIRLAGVLFCIFYFVVIPFLSKYIATIRGFIAKLRLPVYPIWGELVMIIGISVMVYDRGILHRTDTQMTEIAETFISIGMFYFFLSEYWLTSNGKSKTLSTFVYIFSPICTLLGIYFGLLHTKWPS
jgi:hypothetical protein